MNHFGASGFDLQAATLAELGMEVTGAWQWLSDTWLLAERAAPWRAPSAGALLDAVYLELEWLERSERAAMLRSAVRFEIRRATMDPNGDDGGGPAKDLRAAALDLVLPCSVESPSPREEDDPASGASVEGDPAKDDRGKLAERLRREGARPVSGRLFGPRKPFRCRKPHESRRDQLSGGAEDPAWVLDAICGTPAPLPMEPRTPSVKDALWGLVQLAAALDPGVESSIAALECRLVLGTRGSGSQDVGAGNFEGTFIGDLALARRERIELAQLVVSGQFEEALARSRTGGLVGDESLSLGALRAALRHRGAERKSSRVTAGHLRKRTPSDLLPRALSPPSGELQRIARFLASIEQAWPGPPRLARAQGASQQAHFPVGFFPLGGLSTAAGGHEGTGS